MIRSGVDAVEPIVTRDGTLRLRPETPADAAFLFALHECVKGAELELLPVGDLMRQQLLDMQFRAMTASYRSRFPAGRFETVTMDESPIGRLITDDGESRFRIVYIALLPKWRNRGIGMVLMTSVLAGPRSLGTSCEATVALDNLASMRLWSRLGFTERERNDTDLVLEWQRT